MTWFEIRPRDVWLFRDGKPFTAGEDNIARSIFPPTPLTVQGALRQKISEANGLSFWEYRFDEKKNKDVNHYIGSYKAQENGLDTGAFRMRGPFVGLSTDDGTMPLFPCPADLLRYTEKSKCDPEPDHFWITQPNNSGTISNLPEGYQLPEPKRDYENNPGYWITGTAFQQYLHGIVPEKEHYLDKDDKTQSPKPTSVEAALKQNKHIMHGSLVYKNENRFGVSTDSATSYRVEGQLYQAQFVRLTKNISLFVDVAGEHKDADVAGQMTMGGEQRQASNVEIMNTQDLDFMNTPNQQVLKFWKNPNDSAANGFKIIFLTPAYFKNGWLPSNDDWSHWFGEGVKLISAALYKPQRLGGWNSAKGKNGTPRSMHNYVAPGSVYYFKTSETITNPPTAITESPENINDAAHVGFGQVAYATWTYTNENKE